MSEPSPIPSRTLDSLPVGVCFCSAVRDADGSICDFTFEQINEVGAKILGRTAEDLLGKRLLVTFPGNKDTGLFDRYVGVVNTGIPDRHEYRYRADGIDSWFNNWSSKIGDGFVVVFADVTGQRMDRLRTTRAARLVQAMFDQSPFSKALISAESGKIQFTNQAFRDLVTRSPGQKSLVRGQTELSQAGHEILQIVDRVRADGQSFSSGEKPLIMEGGETRFYRIDVRFLAESKRRKSTPVIRQIQISVVDVTNFVASRLQAERLAWRLAEEEEQYRATFSAAPVGIAHLNERGTFRSGNQHLLRLLGMTAAELKDQSLLSLCDHPDDRGPEFDAFFKGSRTTRAVEARIRRRDGSHVWASLTLSPLRDRDGRVKNYVLVVEDISRRVEARKRLVQSMEHKDEFLAILGHELRNPLAALRSAVALLADIPSPEAQIGRIVTTLDRQTKQIGRLLDDLLEVGRISRGKLSLTKKRLNLVALTRRVVEDKSREVESREHNVVFKPTAEEWVIWGDELRMQQVLDNLLTNALKYTPAGGRIEVSVERKDSDVVVAILDNGVGIDPDFLQRLFVPFEQAPQDLARSHGGLGLGLALAAQIVRAHGGAIVADSEGRGKGSKFSVYVPLVEQPAEQAPASENVPLAPARFLIVEDNADAAELMQFLLESKGHEVSICARGDHAVGCILELRPQIVLCDIGLPHLSGYEIAQQVRSHSEISETILIALSGYGRAQDHEKAKQAGFDAQLNKPSDYADISRLAGKLIRQRSRATLAAQAE